ncbi:hypothetical protein LPJ75_000449 [Coemansia sp. RSA 2598]|nr:hypothetical protein LPJ75_000449 [Coemansia sp. RSA 2598]
MPATAQPSRPMLREFVSPHSHVHSGASSGGPAPHIPQPAHGAPWPQPAYYQQPAYHYQNGPAHAQHGAGGYMPHGHPAQPSPYHRHSAASSYASSTPQSSNASVSAPAGHPDQQSPTQPQPRPVKTSISRILG